MTKEEFNAKLWERNVADEYKALSNEEIKVALKDKHFPFAVLMSQLIGDYNFACVIRSANFLGAKEIFYYGKRKYDRRGAQGTYHYSDVNYLSEQQDILKLKEKYVLVALENNTDRNPVALQDFVWPRNSMIILGEEGCGLSPEVLDMCDLFVEIPRYGSVRSLNAAVAASVAMYDYLAKYK